MKNWMISRTIVALLIAVAISGTGCQAQVPGGVQPGAAVVTTTAPTVTVQNVDPKGAAKLMAEHTELQVLDVRTPEEVAGGTLAGAVKINWFDEDFGDRANSELQKDRPVLVYCKAGGRSAQASDKLLQLGFTNVYNMTGGYTQWIDEGRPVEK